MGFLFFCAAQITLEISHNMLQHIGVLVLDCFQYRSFEKQGVHSNINRTMQPFIVAYLNKNGSIKSATLLASKSGANLLYG